ncbi:hypothetical protein SAMN05660359_03373 [Geodermatophilus obscurus]|uniref:Uncharacterized protein n=1 Tax=Geodermatophilus obscurus TaxID=1861 RepID=A0A1I5H306_9ACTN|nr:hypothetical protein [Geodermatophilus obscurus]SFO42615.1 hypothetical protein SAMN05660359_03373 [Geodermatophilus obscurus]
MSRPWSRSVENSTPVVTVDLAWPNTGRRDAHEDVRARVAQLASAGSLDAANGDVLDAWLEGTRRTRRADAEADRTRAAAAAEREVARLEAEVLAADQRLASATAEVAHTERVIGILEAQLLGPAEQPPVESRERRRRPRPTLDPLEGLVRRPWHSGIVIVLLLLAAAGDLATFYIVLATAYREAGPLIIGALTAAFAAASVGLMHGIGRAVKDLREARGGIGRVAIALMTAGWLVLGGVAFAFRLESEDGGTGATGFGTATTTSTGTDPLLSAVLLAGLFLASGLLAYYAGFSEHHPRMKTYLALRKRLPEQGQAVATETRLLNEARQALDLARGDAERAALRTRADIDRIDAEIDELKELVRVEVAAHLGLPEATTGLVTGRGPAS